MKSQTDRRILLAAVIMAVAMMLPGIVSAQVNQNNLMQTMAIQQGINNVNDQVSAQNKALDSLVVLKTIMAGEFVKMKEWEKKYNSYLKTARGYAEQLKAGTTIYLEGVVTFQRILQLKKAIEYNPQGLLATIPMSDIYLEAASEFINTFNMLSKAVSKGGREQMLNGRERTELLWSISGQLEAMNQKFKELALAIGFYNFLDVWNKAIRKYVEKDHGEVARECLNRWNDRREEVDYIFR